MLWVGTPYEGLDRFDSNTELRDVLGVGADDVVRKPIREADLLAKLEALLGVQYRYAAVDRAQTSADARSPGQHLSREALGALPPALTAGLRQAILRADYDAILGLIQESNAVSADVAAALRDRVERFEYQSLLDLLPGTGAEPP